MKTNRLNRKSLHLKQDTKKKKFYETQIETSTLFQAKSVGFQQQKRKKEKIFGKNSFFDSLIFKENFKNKKDQKLSYNFGKGFSPEKNKGLSFKNQSFFNALVKVDAFVGDTYLRSHFSQNSLIYASRNNQDIYDIHSSYNGLKRAMQFLNKQKLSSLIFVGNPDHRSEECKAVFARHKLKFFPSDQWIPGFISKNTQANRYTLVVYDTHTNAGSKNEALSSKLPIVGFLTKYGNVDGLDYPVCINFENCGNWYSALWNTFFLKKLKSKTL